MKTIIIDYGAGNVRSVMFALKRIGVDAALTNDTETILTSDKVIFPGVGHANAAMDKIKEFGLEKVIPALQQPVLGVCLGMQLMCDHTEEGNTKGLGIFNTNVIRFGKENKIPQIGWNQVNELKTPLMNGVKENDFMYFVHSYYVPLISDTIAKTDYGVIYSAALNKNNFYGCQFHPEKSGDAGEQILKNFIAL